jgi:hypothetical protein
LYCGLDAFVAGDPFIISMATIGVWSLSEGWPLSTIDSLHDWFCVQRG